MTILETHIVPAISEEIRLQEYAPQVFKMISSRSGIKKAIKREELLVDGKPGKTSDWIRPNQKLELLQQKKEDKKIFRLKLDVIFQDHFLAVINKPSGYPTSGNYFKTIENALPFNLEISDEPDALPFPLPVHRLDNPTSGILLIAKTRSSLAKLSRDFEQKRIAKTYIALAHGKAPETAVFDEAMDGKDSVTRLKLVKNFLINAESFSLVEAQPETGRTHQIRRHLALHNLPIVGDEIYGSDAELSIFKGLYLAATGIELIHPQNETSLHFSLPYPKKFLKIDILTKALLP